MKISILTLILIALELRGCTRPAPHHGDGNGGRVERRTAMPDAYPAGYGVVSILCFGIPCERLRGPGTAAPRGFRSTPGSRPFCSGRIGGTVRAGGGAQPHSIGARISRSLPFSRFEITLRSRASCTGETISDRSRYRLRWWCGSSINEPPRATSSSFPRSPGVCPASAGSRRS